MPADFIRVEDKATGHQFSIREDQFDDAAVKKLDRPAVDVGGEVIPPKHKTSVAKSAAAKSGQKAETEKETS
jgi:hypothetical protein